MTRVSFLFLIILLIGCCCSTARGGALALYDDDNPIRQVVSKNSILQVIGQTRHALSFLHFARRYGKRYESVEEIKQRFEIFLDNLKMIRSHNKKRLSYKLGVNERLEGSRDSKPSEEAGQVWILLDIQVHQQVPLELLVSELRGLLIPGRSKGAEDELQYAVAFIRPVSVAYQVVKGFKQYESGIYSSTVCGNTAHDVNHAVLAVGYGVENGTPYWLIKNSWGADWGENGYFKMEMGKNMCGIATCASYPIVA